MTDPRPAARVACFAGTFDPPTNGHLDVVRRAARLFDRVVVGVSKTGKETLFTADERLGLLRPLVAGLPGVEVAPFDGLLVDFAKARGAGVLVRGVRTFQDWEYEVRMARMNRQISGLETLFLAPAAEHAHVSSTLIREVAALGADVSGLVPEGVAAALRSRLGRPPGR
jgi:pantetheine-phosphate adenylyltransferase